MENKWVLKKTSALEFISPNANKLTKYLKKVQGPDILSKFDPIVKGKLKESKVSYLSPPFVNETLQAGILLVAHTRSEIRREFINSNFLKIILKNNKGLCEAAVGNKKK
jgi:hypothetical protein